MAAPSASTSASAPALRIEGLVKDYGRVHAVRGIDLEVRRGEVFGFLGSNGAGKTTTIRCILDLLRPTAGRIEVLGLDPRRDGVAVRARTAYVPGELRLPERWTAAELVESIGRLRGGCRHRAPRRARAAPRPRPHAAVCATCRAATAAKSCCSWPSWHARSCSSSTSRRTGCDPLVQHEFLRLVREARDAGGTVFLSSHVLSEVQHVADRVAVLRAGRVVALATRRRTAPPGPAARRGVVRRRTARRELAALAGLADQRVDDHHVSALLCGPIGPLLEVLARHRVVSMLVEEPDLEEAFLDLYAERA